MGSNDTSSNSRPLTTQERSELYDKAQQYLGGYVPAGGYPTTDYREAPAVERASFTDAGPVQSASYTDAGGPSAATVRYAGPTQGATYSDAGDARTLSGGDYDRLEQSILASRMAPLDQAWTRRSQEIDQEMADRGLYASGIGSQSKNKIFARDFLPAYEQAGAEAATQRYGMQSGELQGLNQYGLSRAGQANTFNLGNTQMLNEGELSRANAANTAEQAQAGRLDQYGLNRSNQANTFNLANVQNMNEGTLARANAANAFETTRYGAEEQAAQARAAARNTFEADQAEKRYQAGWRPADYWQGAWNGTGGVVSSSTGGGWSI